MENQFVANIKTNGPIPAADLGVASVSSNSMIRINEYLTKHNYDLLFKARKMLKIDGPYKYVWHKNNKIYVKLDDDSPVHTIYNENDVTRLTKQSQKSTPAAATDQK